MTCLSGTMTSFCSWLVLSTLLLFVLGPAENATVQSIVLTENEGKCRVMGFFPLETEAAAATATTHTVDEFPPFTRWTLDETRRVSHSMMATAFLAVEHFHKRDTSIVPELQTLPASCSVEIDLDVVSEHVDVKRAGQIMVEEAESLCAFLGTYDPDVARAMQPTSAALDLPQVIYYTLDQFLTSSKRPSNIGIPPTVLPHTRGLAEYLNSGQVVPPREFMSLVYEEAYTSSYLAQCFEEDAAEKFGMASEKYQDDHFGIIPTKTAEELQRKVLGEIKESGIRTIFLNKIQSSGLALTATILEDLNMLTDDYLYIFTPQAVPTDAVGSIFGPQMIDSPLDRLLRGGMILDHHDLYRADGDDDPFLKMWKNQDPQTVQKINQMYPDFDLPDDFFQTTHPADYSAFLYDAILSIGMGACYATTEKPVDDTLPFRKDIQVYNFTGATGPIFWGAPDRSCKYKSNRCNDPVKFGIFNIRAVELENGYHTYETAFHAEWDAQNRWIKKQDFVYRDGSTNPPTNLRQASNNNYLSIPTKRFGYFLFGSAAGCSLLGLSLLVYFRKDQTIVRSQPIFLSMICLGSLLMSVSILTLSFDETTATPRGLDAACMSTMWFFFIGHVLLFSALFSRLWRLDSVMQFKRGHSMSREKASIPVVVTVLTTVVILIVWTTIDPWRWTREWVSDIPAETYGQCHSDHFWAFFAPLISILILAEGLTIFFVYKTADINEDFADTRPSIYAMYSQFQAWIVGVPVLVVIDNGSTDAVFLSRSLLIWIFSLSGVVFVIIPRIYKAAYKRAHPENDTVRCSISGIQLPSGSGHNSTPLRRKSKDSINGSGWMSGSMKLSPESAKGPDAKGSTAVGSVELSTGDAESDT